MTGVIVRLREGFPAEADVVDGAGVWFWDGGGMGRGVGIVGGGCGCDIGDGIGNNAAFAVDGGRQRAKWNLYRCARYEQ